MLQKISREMPLGGMLLFISATLAMDFAPNAQTIWGIHILLAGLLFMLLRRATRAGNIVLVAQLAVVFLFSIFCSYVLTIIDRVAVESIFEFRVFTPESVRWALLLNDFGLGIMLLVYGLHSDLQCPSRLFSSRAWGEFGRVVRVPPRLFVAGLYLSWAIIIGSVFLSPSVLNFPYPENNLQPGAIHPTIRTILVLGLFAIFLMKYAQDQFRTSAMGLILRLTTYAAILGVGLLGGSRGSSVGLLIGFVALDSTQSRDSVLWKSVFISINSIFAVFAVVNWPFMRFWISDIGVIPAFLQSFSSYNFLFSAKSNSDAIFLSGFPMLGQSLFHFLYVIVLIDSGSSLHYQTFLNLIPQQLPEFVDGVFWVRPLNDNWLLAEHFHHGGGFYSFANAYWNGGVLALGLFSALLAWILARIEIIFKSLPAYYGAAYFMLILLVPVGFYYGIQGLVRGIEYGLIVCLLIRVVAKYSARPGVVHSKGSSVFLPANEKRV